MTATSKEAPGGFNVRDVRSFDAIHDRYVYVRCRCGKHCLLTMVNAYLGLQDSIAVTVANDLNRVCSHDGASLTYRDFERTRRCVILRVEAVDDRAAALALVARRTQPRVDEVYFLAFLCAFSRARRKSSAS